MVGYGALALVVNAASAEAKAMRLLILGDSLTAGHGLAIDQAFPAQLQRALAARGRDVTVLNAGVSGDTSAGGLARLDWALADRPDAALVELGANDGLRGLDPKHLRANLDAIVARLRERGLPVLLAGMEAPPNLGPDYAKAFRQAFADVARDRKVALYPFFLDGVAGQPRLNQADGLHPTGEGVAVVVGRILPAVVRLLDEKEARP